MFVDTLVDRSEPAAVRLALLDHHYRTDWEWTDPLLDAGVERLALWRSSVDGSPSSVLDDVRAALDDDLATPDALVAVDAAARAGASVREAADLLGVSL